MELFQFARILCRKGKKTEVVLTFATESEMHKYIERNLLEEGEDYVDMDRAWVSLDELLDDYNDLVLQQAYNKMGSYND